jgi:hypothetical protein
MRKTLLRQKELRDSDIVSAARVAGEDIQEGRNVPSVEPPTACGRVRALGLDLIVNWSAMTSSPDALDVWSRVRVTALGWLHCAKKVSLFWKERIMITNVSLSYRDTPMIRFRPSQQRPWQAIHDGKIFLVLISLEPWPCGTASTNSTSLHNRDADHSMMRFALTVPIRTLGALLASFNATVADGVDTPLPHTRFTPPPAPIAQREVCSARVHVVGSAWVTMTKKTFQYLCD